MKVLKILSGKIIRRISPLQVAVMISLVYFTINMALINDFGLSWDFHYHHYAGLHHLGLLVPKISDPPEVPFTPPDPRLTTDDPFGPFIQILPTLSYHIFYEKLHVLSFDSAYNLPPIILGSLGVGIIFIFLFESLGINHAIFGSLSLAFLPVYFGYLHNNMKDIPNTVAFMMTIFLFWRMTVRKRFRDLIFALLSFAVAFNIKVNSIFIPVVCFSWFIISNGKSVIKVIFVNLFRRNFQSEKINSEFKIIILVIIFGIFAPVSALALWFPFWENPLGKLMEIPYFYSHNTLNMPVLFFGKIYRSGVDVPWSYPFLYLGITMPLPILFFFISGLIVSLKRIILNRAGIYLLFVLWFIIPLVRYFFPSNGAIDGVRHFMEVICPLIIISSIGFVRIYQAIFKWQKNKNVIFIFSGIVYFLLLVNLVKYHPYQTSYFNSIIGGIKGAYGLFDIDFWGTPQKGAMVWLNINAKPNAKIFIEMAQSTAATYLREDLRKNLNTTPIWEGDYTVILNRQSYFPPYFAYTLKEKTAQSKIVYTRSIEGVPLVWIFAK
jgi:hypothetical protein